MTCCEAGGESVVYTRHHHSPARKPRRARGLTGHSSSSGTQCPSQLGTSPSLDSRCSTSLLLDVRTVPLLGKSVHQAEAAEKPPEGPFFATVKPRVPLPGNSRMAEALAEEAQGCLFNGGVAGSPHKNETFGLYLKKEKTLQKYFIPVLS